MKLTSIIMAQSTMSSDRIDGLPRPPSRFRRIVVLALFCLLLAVSSSIVRYINRPLTHAEQRLVGTWRNTVNPAVLTFHTDRTVTDQRLPPGRWSIQEGTLTVRESILVELLETIFRRPADESVLTFENDDHIALSNPVNGVTSRWQRASSP